ncbi:MAG TPA: hypothetical protein VF540_11030, partial [Segetibacter sp.]
FFFLGFIASGNSVFIPFSKHFFNLDEFQSQFIDFVSYCTYYLGALGFLAYSSFDGKGFVGKWGLQRCTFYPNVPGKFDDRKMDPANDSIQF